MLIRSDGTAVGTVGGSCVEGDMWYLGTQLLREKGPPLYRTYELNEELSDRGGLVCGGTMKLFIEPFSSPQQQAIIFEKIVHAYNDGPPLAVATLLENPARKSMIGSKILVQTSGNFDGTFEDAELESLVVEAGARLAELGEQKLISDQEGAEVHIEGFVAPPTLLLMGAGHVNKAVSSLAATLDFRVYVLDDREEFANTERFPEAEGVFISDYEDGMVDFPVNNNTFVVVATRGHRFDDLALAAALRTPARYVGLLGSKRKTIMIFRNLETDETLRERIKDVHAPVGLDIGAVSPEELAVSIMAEIIMVRRGGTGAALKMKL
jgi:xanthine dehydrogenase accessory factor